MVVAYDEHRAIGSEGKLPWEGQLPADMRRFRDLTESRSVVMGRKTYESLPEQFRPLPRRENIVVSLSRAAIEGAIVATSIEEAFDKAHNQIMVIGGGQIYEQALPLTDIVYATEIATHVDDADTFFPELHQKDWIEIERKRFEADERNRFAYSFVTYLSRNK